MIVDIVLWFFTAGFLGYTLALLIEVAWELRTPEPIPPVWVCRIDASVRQVLDSLERMRAAVERAQARR